MEGDTVKMDNVEEKSRAKKHCKKKPKVGPPMKTCEEMAKETKGKLEAKKGEVISSNAKPDAGSKDGKGVAKDSRAGTGGKKLQRRKSEGPKMKRKVSNLVFVMPKEADPQAKVQAVAEKKIGKLMRYMKKYWTVHVDKKFYPVKIDFRMPDRMTHQRPENWWLAKRARQKTIDHTGFFSNVMEPYHDLGPPELDTPMLAFKNMHEDLLTDPTKWIQDRIEKDEMIRKCNAPLIRLPRTRVRRPVFNKGRVKIGAGGMLNMDKFVKTGYDFQNAIRGGVSFSLTLDNYMEQKENEIADSASAFGVVVKKQAGNEKAPGTVPSKPGMQKQSEESGELKHTITALKLSSDNKKRSNADDRALQRSLLIFEQMMQAIYDMIRSTLNIRGSQLRSNHPLPLRVVQDIRSTSPVVHVQRRAKKAKVVKDSKSCKDLARSVMSSAILGTGVATTKSNLQTHQDAQKAEKVKQEEVGMGAQEGEAFADGEDEDSISSEMSIKALIHHRGKSVLHTADIDPNHHEEHIATTIVETVKAAHAERDTTSILEEKVKTIRESAEQATNRMLLREETFARLFHKGETLKPPVWKNINIDILFTTDKDVTVQEDIANAVGKEIEGFHLDNENAIVNLPSTPRIPHANEIPTPKLEGLESPPRVDSEEQSKLNLLEKNPEAARKEPPPSPVVYLYKVAGIQTNEKQMFNSLMTLKKKFRATEKALRFYYANETEKEDWETLDRFRRKIRAILPCPIYERSITIMRQAQNKSSLDATMSSTSEKRPALWYRKLRERSDEIGASRHIGCSSLLMKLYKYCDVDMKTRSKMLNRFCLLVVSLPTTELGTREWQLAIKFLMDHLLGSPLELFNQWLEYRGLPSLI